MLNNRPKMVSYGAASATDPIGIEGVAALVDRMLIKTYIEN